MNSWVIQQHFQIDSDIYTDEKCFDDIIDFKYCRNCSSIIVIRPEFIQQLISLVSELIYTTSKFFTNSVISAEFD